MDVTRDLFSKRAPRPSLFLKALRIARRELSGETIEAEGTHRYGALLIIAARLLEAEGMYERLLAQGDSAASAA